MQFSSFIAAALMAPLAFAAPLPQSSNPASIVKRGGGAGTANVHNNCNFDITINPCPDGGDKGFTTIKAGTTWSQPQMDFGGAGKGVSLKLNTVGGDVGNVAQFEYTVSDLMSIVFYDYSLINGNPFGAYIQHLTSHGAGEDVTCAVGETPCAAAYTWPEQVATKAAAIGSDLDLYLCKTAN